MQIPLYYRTDVPEVYKYCCGVSIDSLNDNYYLKQTDPTSYFGLYGESFEIIFKDRTDEEFYYFPFMVSLLSILEKVKYHNKFLIPSDVLRDIKNKKCKILVVCPFEGWSFNYWESLILPIQNLYSLKDKDFVFVTANSYKQDKFNHAYYNFWERQTKFENLTWLNDRGNLSISKKQKRKYKFICLNRRPHAGRFALTTLLYNHRNLGLLSMGKSGQMHPGYFEEEERRFSIGYPEIFQKYKELNIKSRLPIKIDDGRDAEKENPVHDWSTDKFYESFLHICPETYQYNEDRRKFFSEKIFKPIMYMQPFILWGEHHGLKTLREMGYLTFEDIIDESYDEIENNQDRVKQVYKSALEFINKSENELFDALEKIQWKLTHNISHLQYRALAMDINLKKKLWDYLYNNE